MSLSLTSLQNLGVVTILPAHQLTVAFQARPANWMPIEAWNHVNDADPTAHILSAWIAKEELRTLLSTGATRNS